MALTIERHIASAFEKTREWGADIFGVGAEFKRSMPSYWKEVEGDWDDIYRNLNLEIKVRCKIRQFGIMERPPFFDYHVDDENR